MKKYFNYVIMAVMSIIITVMGIGLVDANTRVDNLTTKNMELKNASMNMLPEWIQMI